MDNYMKKYCEQMDQVTLSDTADQAILNELLKTETRKGGAYMKRAKRNISAAMIAVTITAASFVTVCAGVVIHGTIIKSHKAESQVEGIGAAVNVGESYYYDLLAGDAGEIYALTDNDEKNELTDHHALVWKSMDQGDIWEEVLSQPDELKEDSGLFAGDLRKGEDGIEAIVIMMEREDDNAEGGYVNRVVQITADSCTEYDMDEVYTQLGGQDHLRDVKYVNDHSIALVGTEECLIYDIDSQKVIKNLPYNLRMGYLKTQDQFLLYGTEIYGCINAETLEEEEPEEGLQEFVQMMCKKNNAGTLDMLFPPMAAWKDTIVCVTKEAIYEYKDGEITQSKQLSSAVNNGHAFNGLLPFCKTGDGAYYVCTFDGAGGMSLWQIDGNKEEMK